MELRSDESIRRREGRQDVDAASCQTILGTCSLVHSLKKLFFAHMLHFCLDCLSCLLLSFVTFSFVLAMYNMLA